jgi:hypothetical protein
VLIIGRGSGIAGAMVLAGAYRGSDIGIEHVDVADESSIAALTALSNAFLTGVSIPVDGGEHLV